MNPMEMLFDEIEISRDDEIEWEIEIDDDEIDDDEIEMEIPLDDYLEMFA
jgi:hypothetical protein